MNFLRFMFWRDQTDGERAAVLAIVIIGAIFLVIAGRALWALGCELWLDVAEDDSRKERDRMIVRQAVHLGTGPIDARISNLDPAPRTMVGPATKGFAKPIVSEPAETPRPKLRTFVAGGHREPAER